MNNNFIRFHWPGEHVNLFFPQVWPTMSYPVPLPDGRSDELLVISKRYFAHPISSELSPQSLTLSQRHQYGRQLPLAHLNIQSRHVELTEKNDGRSVVGRGITLDCPIDEQFSSSDSSSSPQSFSPSQTWQNYYVHI